MNARRPRHCLGLHRSCTELSVAGIDLDALRADTAKHAAELEQSARAVWVHWLQDAGLLAN